jgi:spore coat protein A, manganese oxidase
MGGRVCLQAMLRLVVGTGLVIAASAAPAWAQGTTTDYTGDGRADFAIVTVGLGGSHIYWVADSNSSSYFPRTWGMSGDIAVGGDFDGDSKVDVAVWRPGSGGSAGYWVHRSSDGQPAFIPFGTLGDDPKVIGDYDADGKTDAAVLRITPSGSGTQPAYWYHRRSSDGVLVGEQWGVSGDTLAPGDYDGDGKTDVAIWRASTRQFWVLKSSGGVLMRFWGVTDLDYPVAAANVFTSPG